MLRNVDEPTPIHQPEDCQNRLLGIPYASHQVRCQTNCQIVEKREQGAFVDRHSGPAAGNLKINHIPLRACERIWRKSEGPIGWARRRRLGWRAQGNVRHDPSPVTRQPSCEKSQAIMSKEPRRDIRLSAAVMFATQLATDLGFAAAHPRKKSQCSLRIGVLDPRVVDRSTKKSSSFARADLHGGRERVCPKYSLRVHCWAADLARSEG
jgi:hypothetical protein